MTSIDPLTLHIVDGTIGGILYVLVSKLGYDHRWDIVRRLGIGIIGGYIAWITKIPDLATVGLGYIGIDAIEAILIKNNLIEPPTIKYHGRYNQK